MSKPNQRSRIAPGVPSAEERAELLALAGDADGFERFIEAAVSRPWQFVCERWTIIERLASSGWHRAAGRQQHLGAKNLIVVNTAARCHFEPRRKTPR